MVLRLPVKERKSPTITEYLLIFLACTILTWYLRILWKNRKIYWASLSLPGPFALPIIGSALYFIGKPSDIFGQIVQMFDSYPSVYRVWLGPRMFYGVSDPKYLEKILTSPQALAKENLHRMIQPVVGSGLFSNLSVPDWKKNRKLINPTFNQQILDRFMVVFVEQSEVLAEVLKEIVGEDENYDIIKTINRCTLDIICETAMGVQIKAQSTDSSFPKWVDRILEVTMIRMFNIYYHSDLIFNSSPIAKEFYDIADKMRTFTKKVILERKEARRKEKFESKDASFDAEGTKRTAFLDLLIDINHEAKDFKQFTDEQLMDETITFLIAGSDTTATANSFVLTMLALHQDIQEKVLKEIFDVVGEEGSIQLSHLPNLKQLERVIKETLRLFPIGPILARTAEEDIDLGDCTIQKGCSMVLGILKVHRNEKYWKDPLKFDPDRYLPENTAKIVPGSYLPFSYGPRNCIGMKYAMMAMKTLLATVIRRYRLSTSYKSIEEIELKANLVIRPTDGFKLTFEFRE